MIRVDKKSKPEYIFLQQTQFKYGVLQVKSNDLEKDTPS